MLSLYNTLTRKIEQFTPPEDHKVKLYTCGLTVYSQPHIGNWVAYIYWDLLVRTLKANDYDVERVQNITDVGHLTDDGDAGEDKMLASALREGKTAWDVAEKYIKIADHEAFDLLGLLRPEHMPRATDYISQQIAFVEELEKKGYTYQLNDGVYFDTSKLSDYGKLAKLDISGLHFGARVADTGKKNPTDFALWKFSPVDQKRDMEWDSPWGKGFPGWHLECSVMARELLGDQIDIHTGGIDHIPVHHTNEIAQTEAVTGKPFSRFWVHANHIKVDGRKMSKSLDNIYTLEDIQEKGYDLRAFKLLVLSKHYSTEGNFTWEILDAAQNRLKGWQSIADLRHQPNNVYEFEMTENYVDRHTKLILDNISNNLDTVNALNELEAVMNDFTISKRTDLSILAFGKFLQSVDELLGINLLSEDITNEQKQLLIERQTARENKDWQRSDEIRDELSKQGVGLNDQPKDTVWYYL